MRTKDDTKAQLKAWAQEAGLDEAGIEKLLASDRVLDDATNHLRRHDEMASAIDRANNQVKETESKYTKWYNEVAQPAVANANKLKERHDRYVQQFGDLEEGLTGNGVVRDASGKFVSREDLNAHLVTSNNLSKVWGTIGTMWNRKYADSYGDWTPEKADEFEKFAVSRGIAPLDAFREFTSTMDRELREQKEAKEKADIQAQIKAAREEGVREGMTRRQWNGESTRRDTDAFGVDLEARKLAKEDPVASDKAGDDAFLKAWDQWEVEHANSVR